MSGDPEVRERLARLPRPAMPQALTDAIAERLLAERTVVPLTPRHRSRLNWLLAAAAVLAFTVLVGVNQTAPSAPPVAGPPVVRAGAVFEPAGFAAQLQQRFHTPAGPTGTTRTFADSPQGISACARAVQAHGRVLTLDVGTYGGTAAVVIVTSYLPNADYEEVWVVDPACGPDDTLVLRHMVFDLDAAPTR